MTAKEQHKKNERKRVK